MPMFILNFNFRYVRSLCFNAQQLYPQLIFTWLVFKINFVTIECGCWLRFLRHCFISKQNKYASHYKSIVISLYLYPLLIIKWLVNRLQNLFQISFIKVECGCSVVIQQARFISKHSKYPNLYPRYLFLISQKSIFSSLQLYPSTNLHMALSLGCGIFPKVTSLALSH